MVGLTFVESSVFAERWKRRLGDEDLRQLQLEILNNPAGGDSIPGCGILRKLRFRDAARGKGKRGGVRVIYVATLEVSRVDLITVYGKEELDNLRPAEVKMFCSLARLLREEAMESSKRRGEKPRGRGQ